MWKTHHFNWDVPNWWVGECASAENGGYAWLSVNQVPSCPTNGLVGHWQSIPNGGDVIPAKAVGV